MRFSFINNKPQYDDRIRAIINNFSEEGNLVSGGKRNSIKCIDVHNNKFNFKSFKKPNIFNRVVYRYIRKSKARRSYEHANLLIRHNFLTPNPIAYFEEFNFLGLQSSFYISDHLENIATLREIIVDTLYPQRDEILKCYTKLIHKLHEIGIEFIDNTSANFLIQKTDSEFLIYLVDLNRMKFHKKMKLKNRLKNISRISSDSHVLKIISHEYASLCQIPADFCRNKIVQYHQGHQLKFLLKKYIKSKLEIKKDIRYKTFKEI